MVKWGITNPIRARVVDVETGIQYEVAAGMQPGSEGQPKVGFKQLGFALPDSLFPFAKDGVYVWPDGLHFLIQHIQCDPSTKEGTQSLMAQVYEHEAFSSLFLGLTLKDVTTDPNEGQRVFNLSTVDGGQEAILVLQMNVEVTISGQLIDPNEAAAEADAEVSHG